MVRKNNRFPDNNDLQDSVLEIRVSYEFGP